jgi:hypothetical protein
MKTTHGGNRIGSGRPRKEPTTTINFRVPVARKNELKKILSDYLIKVLQLSK